MSWGAGSDSFSAGLAAAAQGAALGLGLIVAIGAQNAFVLRQGLKREHVASVVVFCALADAVLIAAGVLGMAQALGRQPALARMLALAGVIFLVLYALKALQRACRPQSLAAVADRPISRSAAVAQAAAFTLLNPHVYLDTVLLMGSIGAQQPVPLLQAWFIVGASAASLAWFTTLGFGARALAPVFARPRAWQVLDALIAFTLLVLAALLLRHVWA